MNKEKHLLDNKQIVEHYLNTELTITQTAKSLGVSYSRAWRAIAGSAKVPALLIQARRSKRISELKQRENSPCRKLTEEQAKTIYKQLRAGVLQKHIAKEHDVEPSVISRMKQGKTYRDCWKKYYRTR